jgi:hypothetical protein
MAVTPGSFDSSFQGEDFHRHRKRRRNNPWGVVVLLAILVLGGLSVPLIHRFLPKYRLVESSAPAKAPASSPADTSRTAPLPLTLANARFQEEGGQRCIVGDVKNASSQRIKNVVVTLNLHVNSDSTAALAVARIPSIEPNSTAHFRTNPVPTPIRRFFVRSIDGDRP